MDICRVREDGGLRLLLDGQDAGLWDAITVQAAGHFDPAADPWAPRQRGVKLELFRGGELIETRIIPHPVSYSGIPELTLLEAAFRALS